MFYTVNNFLELTVPSFIIRLEGVKNGATCLEIAMEIPKIVLNTFNGKGKRKNVFEKKNVLYRGKRICIDPFPNTHLGPESLNNTKEFFMQLFRYQKYIISCDHVAFRVHK